MQLLFIVQFVGVVKLDYFELFEPFSQNFVLILIGVDFFAHIGIIFLELLEFTDHLSVDILFYSR